MAQHTNTSTSIKNVQSQPSELQAFHNSDTIKEKYLNRVINHRNADEIVQGTYWKDGKGSAVACTIDSMDREKYETQLGIPEWVAKLEDFMFEGLSLEDAKKFPEKFLNAIPVGFSNWDKVWHELSIFAINYFADASAQYIREQIDQILCLHQTQETDENKWISASNEIRQIGHRLRGEYLALTAESTSKKENEIPETDISLKFADIYKSGSIARYTTSKDTMDRIIPEFEDECINDVTTRKQQERFIKIAEKTLEILENQK